ncbi:hypothetical protein HAX54_036451, partial [Datura stramonium]|nr:hypothetical protein [Datura stramonium]
GRENCSDSGILSKYTTGRALNNWRTRYGAQDDVTEDPVVIFLVHYSGPPTVVTVSLHQLSHRCSGPP